MLGKITSRAPSPSPGPDPAELLTMAYVADDVLHCSQDTVRRMVARGELTAVRIGPRLIRIRRRDLERAMRPVTRIDLVTAGGGHVGAHA